MQTVADLVRDLREEKSLTQRALAAKARVPRSTIGSVETGARSINKETARKVFSILLK